MRRVFVGFLVISFSLLIKSCDTTNPPDNKSLTLKLEDVSCTEAWITLKTTNLQLPATITLKQTNPTGDTKSQILNLNTKDSLLYIDSLLPKQNYSFTACHSGLSGISSNELSVTTMDTTSHNFTFETFTFGEHGNSVLFDVAIVGDEIWAVGEIYMNDSLGNPDQNFYNIIKWNGGTWDFERIYYNYQGSNFLAPLRSVFAFSSNDIWLGSNQPMHWTGTLWEKWDLQGNIWEGWINKIWGANSDDIYVVGNNGNIARYLNGTWSRIESGTDVDLLDVWGTTDGKIVWVSGINLNKTILIKIESNIANIVFEDQYPWQIKEGRISGGISSIWTNSKNFIYLTTPITAYRCLSTTSGEGKEIYPFDDYLNGGTIRIRGNSGNDIITSGSNCSILHYNGFSWKRYEQFTDINTVLWSSNIKGNILAAVGDKLENLFYYKAIIIVGNR